MSLYKFIEKKLPEVGLTMKQLAENEGIKKRIGEAILDAMARMNAEAASSLSAEEIAGMLEYPPKDNLALLGLAFARLSRDIFECHAWPYSVARHLHRYFLLHQLFPCKLQ